MSSRIGIIVFMYRAEKCRFTFVEWSEKNVFMGEAFLFMFQDQ